MLGLPKGEVYLVPWTSDWLDEFIVESSKIQFELGELVVAVHHVGSTAVKGLASKPIKVNMEGRKGKMPVEVILKEYNPDWINQFEIEKKLIQQTLQQPSILIEHIGSTSVIGLLAKPIIDIAIGVQKLHEAESFIEPLSTINYEYVPKADFPNRLFFRKGLWRQGTHHLHIYDQSSEEWSNYLLFRNYLRAHPQKMQEYAELKKKLAHLHAEDRAIYTKLKAPFIQSIIDLAKLGGHDEASYHSTQA